MKIGGSHLNFDDIIAALVGLIIGVTGQFVADLTTSIFTGQWQFSSIETYIGSAVGGLAGGWASLYISPLAGAALGAGISTLIGQGLEYLTCTNLRSFDNILVNTFISIGLATITAGLIKTFKIPGINSGRHSFNQVWNSGKTKAINYGYKISLKTLSKGFVSTLLKEYSLGWLVNNIIAGSIEAFKINIKNLRRKLIL